MEYKHSITQIALQLRDQLSSEKRKLGFFFGAGTSMAVGVPGVFKLTEMISEKLVAPYKTQFEAICKATDSKNIEQILNKLRTVRELIGESETEEFYGIKGKKAGTTLDIEICKMISEIISKTDISTIGPHLNFYHKL